MSKLLEARQALLIQTYKNPLIDPVWTEFFKSLPQKPGVYWMLGRREEILYIGKAKNLRNRLRSYRQVTPENASRKVVHMVKLIMQIRWKECEDEEKALLHENELLRKYQPPFNVVNTHPEGYYFIGYKSTLHHMDLSLTTVSELPGYKLFGVYKGRGLTRKGYAALLRLLWVSLSPSTGPEVSGYAGRFKFPGALVRRRVAASYGFRVDSTLGSLIRGEWEQAIAQFLDGASENLLVKVTEALLEHSEIHPFYYHFIQENLEILREFYQYGPLRNATLRQFHGLTTEIVPQDQIDDLLVIYKMRSLSKVKNPISGQ